MRRCLNYFREEGGEEEYCLKYVLQKVSFKKKGGRKNGKRGFEKKIFEIYGGYRPDRRIPWHSIRGAWPGQTDPERSNKNRSGEFLNRRCSRSFWHSW